MLANKPYIIGLTGGIGCGKSEAARFLRSLGAYHVDADAISHNLTGENGEALPEIRNQFGDDYFNDDGSLNRARMGETVFNDAAARRALEGILHPLVQRDMLREMDEAALNGAKVVILDVPLLYETGMDALCDESWTMSASRETQTKRIMDRDGLSREQAEIRIDSQISCEERNARATRIINTDRAVERTQAELASLYNAALKKASD